MQPVEALVARSWYVRIAIIGVMLAPLAGLFFAGAVNGFITGKGPGVILLFLALATLGCFAYFPFNMRRMVQHVDDAGVTTRGGTRYAWKDLAARVSNKRGAHTVRYDLVFSVNGSKRRALVYPLALTNHHDVLEAIDARTKG